MLSKSSPALVTRLFVSSLSLSSYFYFFSFSSLSFQPLLLAEGSSPVSRDLAGSFSKLAYLVSLVTLSTKSASYISGSVAVEDIKGEPPSLFTASTLIGGT